MSPRRITDERASVEDRLSQVRSDLDQAASSFDSSVTELSGLLGTTDTARFTATKDAMHLWSDAVRTLTEEERALQRRLDHLTSRELTHSALKAVRASSRAAWAAFWAGLVAMFVSTAAVVLVALPHLTELSWWP